MARLSSKWAMSFFRLHIFRFFYKLTSLSCLARRNVTVDDKEKIKIAAEIIGDAEALLISAGAGMGVDSGLPDFRGGQGFWNAYPPYRKLNLDSTYTAGLFPIRDSTCCCAGRQAKPGVILFLPPTSTASSRKPASLKRESMNAMARSFTCSARPDARGRSGRSVTGWSRWTKGPCAPGRRCRIARSAAGWRGPTCGAGTAVPSVRRMSEQRLGRPGTRLVRINAREADVPSGQVGLAGGALSVLKKIGEFIPGSLSLR
jgi:hypothetical protein